GGQPLRTGGFAGGVGGAQRGHGGDDGVGPAVRGRVEREDEGAVGGVGGDDGHEAAVAPGPAADPADGGGAVRRLVLVRAPLSRRGVPAAYVLGHGGESAPGPAAQFGTVAPPVVGRA